MDIDISDPAFSLGINNVNQVVGNIDIIDNTMFIYICAALLVVIIGMFIYKFYIIKKTNSEDNVPIDLNSKLREYDCPGGFCGINKPE